MGTGTGTGTGAMEKTKAVTALVKRTEVARRIGVESTTIRRWVERGDFPEPTVRVGSMTFWPSEWIDEYVGSGSWPAGVRFRDGT